MQEDRTLDYYIDIALRRMDMGDYATEVEVDRAYRRVVGDLISRLTLGVYYSKGVLRLRLNSAGLKNELLIRRHSLQDKLNADLGRNVIKKIVLL